MCIPSPSQLEGGLDRLLQKIEIHRRRLGVGSAKRLSRSGGFPPRVVRATVSGLEHIPID